MIRFTILRHGKTKGNSEGRYMGRADEDLSLEGEAQISGRDYSCFQDVQRIFVSPLIRCIHTAGIIFPGKSIDVIPGFIECDFGDFEYKNYKEMSDNKDYQAWVDSGGTLPFPNGESVEGFRERSANAMKEAIDICIREGIENAGAVIHGGVIMSIMAELCETKREFYDWHSENGCGYIAEADSDYRLRLIDEITF